MLSFEMLSAYNTYYSGFTLSYRQSNPPMVMDTGKS